MKVEAKLLEEENIVVVVDVVRNAMRLQRPRGAVVKMVVFGCKADEVFRPVMGMRGAQRFLAQRFLDTGRHRQAQVYNIS